MRFFDTLTVAFLFLSQSNTVLSHPQPIEDIQLLSREQAEALDKRNANPFADADVNELWKRKGGGGGGGKGGGSSGGSGKGGSSSGSGSSSGKGSSTSNSGGSTKTGSGVTPNYGGGRYYGGGATTPYASGVRSPLGIAPVFLGVGLLSIYPGLWLYGAYSYPYYHPYTFHNRTGRANSTNTTTTRRDMGLDVITIRQTTEGVNETKPVTCLCAAYAECGCDDNGNSTFLDSVIGDGTYANLNQSLVTVADVNGTSTILLNGTLPNGTTASGGTEDANGAAIRMSIEMSGYWVMIALVMATVYLV